MLRMEEVVADCFMAHETKNELPHLSNRFNYVEGE